MIQRIEIQGFKTFRDVALDLGPFNLLIGANGSGKSNFLDALRFLQGIGHGLTISEILNGKPRSATGEVWEGIRGGSERITHSGPSGVRSVRVSIRARLPGGQDRRSMAYRCMFEVAPMHQVTEEDLLAGDRPVIERRTRHDGVDSVRVGGKEYIKSVEVNSTRQETTVGWARRASLGPIASDDRSALDMCSAMLANQHHLTPEPAILRGYSSPAATARRMGPHGEDFAAVVAQIATDADAKAAFDEWLGRLSPDAIRSAEIMRGALGEAMFAAKDASGTVWPAPTLSDGTLRFAALAAAMFQPDPPGLLCLEEIENGIHPTRLRLLLELFRARSGEGRQIVATTHSPLVLEWLTQEEYAHALWFHRDDETGETHVTPLSQVPGLVDAVRRRPISELLSEGWLETVL